VRLVVGEGIRPAGVGIATGLVVAFWGSGLQGGIDAEAAGGASTPSVLTGLSLHRTSPSEAPQELGPQRDPALQRQVDGGREALGVLREPPCQG